MGYEITFIVVAGLIGLYFAKREKQMSHLVGLKALVLLLFL